MTKENLFEAFGGIDAKFIEQAEEKGHSKKWIGLLAACLCLVIGGMFLLPRNADFATVTHGYSEKDLPNHFVMESLVGYTEEEMFAMDLYIFRGRITALENYTIDYNGTKDIRCVATIAVETVYQGDIGDSIRMLLPCPLIDGVYTSISGLIDHFEVGMEGIFMPRRYTKNSYREENGAKFMLSELADCGLDDGIRWIFLQSGDKLLYSQTAYPSAASAKTLEDIEKYIQKMMD